MGGGAVVKLHSLHQSLHHSPIMTDLMGVAPVLKWLKVEVAHAHLHTPVHMAAPPFSLKDSDELYIEMSVVLCSAP